MTSTPSTPSTPGTGGTPSTRGTRAAGQRDRWPRSVYGHGSEPDPRFSLANERTFLAWLRTSLALIAAGVGLETIAPPVHPALRVVVTVTVISLGMGAAVNGWRTWARAERAMREARPLHGPTGAAVIGACVVVVGGLLIVGFLLGHDS